MKSCPQCGYTETNDQDDLWARAMQHDLGSVADSVEEPPFVQPSPVFTLIRRVQADWRVWWVW